MLFRSKSLFAAILAVALACDAMGQSCPPGTQCGPQGCFTAGLDFSGRQAPQRPAAPARVTPRSGLALPSIGSPHPAVVRVCNETDRHYNYGSGTLIEEAGQSLILTCAHTFREGSNRIYVGFPDGQRLEAKLLKQDQQWDLAVLAIPTPDWRVLPRKIATDWPKVGEEVRSYGWGGVDMTYRCNLGYVKGYSRTTETSSAEMLELTGYARDGDSGGPIFNGRGEVVAVCWGTDGKTVHGTFCGRIRRFLAGIVRPLVPVERRPPVQAKPPAVVESPPVKTRPPPVTNPFNPWSPPANTRPPDPSFDPTLGNRLEGVEKALAGLAAGAVTESPSLMTLAVPAVLAGLGWTGPPAIAVVMGLRVLSAIRRRRKKERAGDPVDEFRGTVPRDDTEAAQFLRLSQLEGRSPVHDALVGRIAFDELEKTIESQPNEPQADWARRLKRTLEDRFNAMAPVALAAGSNP